MPNAFKRENFISSFAEIIVPHSKVNERSETKTSDKLTEINSLKNILLSYNETSTIFFSSF